MQSNRKKSYICGEESKSYFNKERNAIPLSKCEQHLKENTCDAIHTNECANCHFINLCKHRLEFNETKHNTEEDMNFHFSDEEIESEMKPKIKDIPNDCSKKPMSPIEEFRTDGKDWRHYHTSTSTPTSDNNAFPEVCNVLKIIKFICFNLIYS